MRQKLIILPKLNDARGDLSKKWFIYYSARDPRTGKMVRFRHYDGFTGLNKQQRYSFAEQAIENYTARLRTGWSPFTDDNSVIYNDHIDYQPVAKLYGARRAGNKTLRVVISKFLDFVQPGLSLSTWQTYRSKLRLYTLYTESKGMEGNDISTYTNQSVIDYFNFLINTKKLSGRSIEKYQQIFNAFFNYCLDQKLITLSPVYGIPRCTRINDMAPRPIQRADIEEFKKEIIKDPELALAVQLEYYCALRPGHELRELQLKDLDLVAGTIRVTRMRAKVRKERIVTIPRQLQLQLRDYANYKSLDRSLYLFGKGGSPGSTPVGKNHFRVKFNKIRTRLKMPNEYKFYSWKHTAAVELDDSLIPGVDISRHMGHSNISITWEYMQNKKGSVSKAIRDNYPTW